MKIKLKIMVQLALVVEQEVFGSKANSNVRNIFEG